MTLFQTTRSTGGAMDRVHVKFFHRIMGHIAKNCEGKRDSKDNRYGFWLITDLVLSKCIWKSILIRENQYPSSLVREKERIG